MKKEERVCQERIKPFWEVKRGWSDAQLVLWIQFSKVSLTLKLRPGGNVEVCMLGSGLEHSINSQSNLRRWMLLYHLHFIAGNIEAWLLPKGSMFVSKWIWVLNAGHPALRSVTFTSPPYCLGRSFWTMGSGDDLFWEWMSSLKSKSSSVMAATGWKLRINPCCIVAR